VKFELGSDVLKILVIGQERH